MKTSSVLPVPSTFPSSPALVFLSELHAAMAATSTIAPARAIRRLDFMGVLLIERCKGNAGGVNEAQWCGAAGAGVGSGGTGCCGVRWSVARQGSAGAGALSGSRTLAAANRGRQAFAILCQTWFPDGHAPRWLVAANAPPPPRPPGHHHRHRPPHRR